MGAPRQRLFHLTIGVHMWGEQPLPERFEDWLRVAFGDSAVDAMGACSTTLENVTELRYPLSDDVIARRHKLTGPVYS